jgi:hypothetical protein
MVFTRVMLMMKRQVMLMMKRKSVKPGMPMLIITACTIAYAENALITMDTAVNMATVKMITSMTYLLCFKGLLLLFNPD